ncbi:MAG TPA: hypothetical protein VMT47_03140 [Polyangia bacterium]|nr:hypothetical protein [Polyangia bacterium]
MSADHSVYFEGNVYDGAVGTPLMKAMLTSIAIEYRDKAIKVAIGDDGRFTSQDPLPTWQDYMVTIMAAGYRPFVSHNPGFEVPASLAAMQSGLAQITTTQTFSFDAYVFPTSLKAPALTLSIATVDDATGAPALGKASGTIRLRPQTQSGLQVGAGDSASGAPRASRRVWANDEDLLTQTIIKPFMNGKVDFAMGDLVYGVQYEVSIYDVDGYQPTVLSGAAGIVAGSVLSKTIQLAKVLRDPLRITGNTATMCTPPTPAATTPGAQIVLTFSENIEAVGTTLAEDVDNGLSIVSVPMPAAFSSCQLKLNVDPTKQERGSSVAISGMTMTFAFNPSVGLTDGMGGLICTAPASISSVTYGNLSAIVLQPLGDPSRKRNLAQMLQELSPTTLSTSLVCPTHP